MIEIAGIIYILIGVTSVALMKRAKNRGTLPEMYNDPIIALAALLFWPPILFVILMDFICNKFSKWWES